MMENELRLIYSPHPPSVQSQIWDWNTRDLLRGHCLLCDLRERGQEGQSARMGCWKGKRREENNFDEPVLSRLNFIQIYQSHSGNRKEGEKKDIMIH